MIHIIPLNDLKEHLAFGTGCSCEPYIIYEEEEVIVVHNSFDGREGVEWANEILNNTK